MLLTLAIPLDLIADPWPAVQLLRLSEVALGLCIVALAGLGYRRNRSRPMLYLALGIGSVTLLSPVAMLVAAQLVPVRFVPLVDSGLNVVGFLLVLYSIAHVRRESHSP